MFEKEFESDYPNIDLQWGSGGLSGEILAIYIAEKDNPKADTVWGLAAANLALLSKAGYLKGYVPEGVDQSNPNSVCASMKPPFWAGQFA